MSHPLPATPAKRNQRLFVLGVLILLCGMLQHQLGDLRLEQGAFLFSFAAAFTVYLSALWVIRSSDGARPGPSLLWILAIAGIVRVLMLGADPQLSTDIYRYRWDGRVQAAGVDPYAYAPADPRLMYLRDASDTQIHFSALRTVYPPVAQAAFRIGVSIHPDRIGQKIVFVLAEGILIAALLLLLAQRKMNLLWIVAYVWHPLPILEIAGSGHNDVLAAAWLWVGLAAWQARRYFGVSLAWALALLSKYASVLMVPWWLCRREGRWWLAVFVLISALPFALNPNIPSALIESLTAVSARIESNASVFLALLELFGSPLAACAVTLLLWAGLLGFWAWRFSDPVAYLCRALAATALLSPVLHPWYLLLLIPCLCFWRPKPIVALTGTVILAYAVWPGYLARGVWELPAWARFLEYGSILMLFVWEAKVCAWRSFFRPATKPQLLVKS